MIKLLSFYSLEQNVLIEKIRFKYKIQFVKSRIDTFLLSIYYNYTILCKLKAYCCLSFSDFIIIIFGTMLAFWFYLSSLKYLPPQETSLLANMEPLTSIVTSVIWLKMSFGMYQLFGMFLIIMMVTLLTVVKEKNDIKKPKDAAVM